jgi:hypothetical protein
VLPKGHYFKVWKKRDSYWNTTELKLSICNRWMGLIPVRLVTANLGSDSSSQERILYRIKLRAPELITQMEFEKASALLKEQQRKMVDIIVGNYPPKVLGEAQNTPKRID